VSELAPASAPARVGGMAPEPIEPERYKVQFTATEEYVRLVEEAKALLSHAAPHLTLEEIQLRAMRVLVSVLTKQKYATMGASGPRRSGATSTPAHPSEVAPTNPSELGSAPADSPEPIGMHPHRRGRHIPAAVRRAVYERDGKRCTYLDSTGTQCQETHRLEFHHLKPFASGGEHNASNLTLRCRAHNALAAEEDFGRELIEDKRHSSAHDAFGSSGAASEWSSDRASYKRREPALDRGYSA